MGKKPIKSITRNKRKKKLQKQFIALKAYFIDYTLQVTC